MVIKYLSSGQEYLKQNPIRSFSNIINYLQNKEQMDILIKNKGNIIMMEVMFQIDILLFDISILI